MASHQKRLLQAAFFRRNSELFRVLYELLKYY